jgi:hypothetical protein
MIPRINPSNKNGGRIYNRDSPNFTEASSGL